MEILNLLPEHYPQVNTIYLEGIASGNATFQTEGKTWEDWDEGHLKGCRFVAIDGGTVLGWVALSPVSSRCVYAGVAETSVYIAQSVRGRRLGYALMQRLIPASEAEGIWTLQAGIFPENKASIRLHQACGFRIVGTRERIGKMQTGEWRDTVLLERRSDVAGL